LTRALEDVQVLITCVGPFTELGWTAVDAALQAGVHYVDSTGEGTFIGELKGRDREARDRGIAMAPAMGFDEVPADVAVDLACEGLDSPQVDVTYAFPRKGSAGTIRTTLDIISTQGPWIEGGKTRLVRAGEVQRWSPMPPPLGPRSAVSFPFALGHLAPQHVDVDALRLFITIGRAQEMGLRWGAPLLKRFFDSSAAPLADRLLERLPEGPNEKERKEDRWTILAEARSGSSWRNVTLQGNDVYGLTAELLAAASEHMASDGYRASGVLAPVQAVDRKILLDVLTAHGVRTETYAPV
jgi:short subunit dehydrogenase-like uncharacterized protein